MGELWAHSRNAAGDRHRLEDHLAATAALAQQFGTPFGAGELAGYLGLVHDVGKGSCAWQAGLASAEESGRRVGLDHKCAGRWLASASVDVFAAAVEGHHGGLPAVAAMTNQLNSSSARLKANWTEVIDRVAAIVPEIRPHNKPAMPQWYGGGHMSDPLVCDVLMRLVFSALVDADFLDTEAHFRGAVRDQFGLSAADLAERYEAERAVLLGRGQPCPADEMREAVYSQALAAATGPTGMYRMAAPTGSGKTLAAGGFAVHHARAHGLHRVVVAVPFISITEQNAAVYRRLLDRSGEPAVLEHHSGAGLDKDGGGHGWWRKLAAENWDAPFVVTTTVQLFESLFDHRPAAMRKLHRLARSVIVLDEVQALPDRLLVPILCMLRTLTECFGTTVLLASATQPAYWALPPFHGLPVTDVIAEPKPLYGAARRVRYRWRLDPKPSLGDIAAQAAPEPQVLIVVNTTSDSATLHRRLGDLRDSSLGPSLHLSTRMAARHRRDVLTEIRHRLAAGEPVAVVSTQLIEAGVDVDFPLLFRAWAPADSLQQAAGRANRSARLREGTVVIFDAADGGHPRDAAYTAALAATRTHFGPGRADPDDLDALEAYYPERFALQNLDAAGDGARVQHLRTHLDFPETAACFRLIDEHTVPVAVEYGDDRARAEMARVADRLRRGDARQAGEARRLLRRLQPFIAALPRALARRAVDAGHAEPVIGDLLQWRGPYSQQRGIDLASITDPRSTEVYVW